MWPGPKGFFVGLCQNFVFNTKINFFQRGETSIEAHINKSERKRYRDEGLGQDYVNPYDFGQWRNWCLFLGMTDHRGWASVLLPSSHPPKGDGLEWDTVYDCNVNWNPEPKPDKPASRDSYKIA